MLRLVWDLEKADFLEVQALRALLHHPGWDGQRDSPPNSGQLLAVMHENGEELLVARLRREPGEPSGGATTMVGGVDGAMSEFDPKSGNFLITATSRPETALTGF